jgi:hypothetical protein
MTGAIGHVTLRDGVRLEYEERGDPDGIPVLLLHGATDSRRSRDGRSRTSCSTCSWARAPSRTASSRRSRRHT